MGGKTKQRTKNNVRPSSSSRSAGILNNAVNQESSFILGGGQIMPGLFPTLAAVNLDQGLTPEFQLCVKKLNKKDPITRTKALQELCELVKDGNEQDVVAALPSWTHYYKALTADIDRKVRELAQLCHHEIMRKCGRRVAPHLKALMPSWLQAQYDEHPPAQSNAQLSLTSTFPDYKLPEVIVHCRKEVMAHLLENLIGNTEAIISKKIEDPQERELQMIRIITGSLRGMEYFITNLSREFDEWLMKELIAMFNANRFWKFATHTSPQVRAAWYAAVGRIISRYGHLFSSKYGLKTVRVILTGTKDSNVLVTSQAWTCLLQFMHYNQDWNRYLDKQDLIVKRVMDVLETGGWGDAKYLSTMLLPLLANMTNEILTKEFYENFFNSIFKGFNHKNILVSKAEQKSWITSLGECLRYLSTQSNDFVIEVVTSVHRLWLETILMGPYEEQTKNHLIKYSAHNMGEMVKYWLKLSNQDKTDKYEHLLRNFWLNIGATVLMQVDYNVYEISKIVEFHITLLKGFQGIYAQEPKKQLNIKFDDDKKAPKKKTQKAIEEYDPFDEERYNHCLEQLVQRVCSNYFEVAGKKRLVEEILTPLLTLLRAFNNKELFLAIARHFHADSLFKFFENVIQSWMLAAEGRRLRALMNVAYLISNHMTDDEQLAVLDAIAELGCEARETCLQMSVTHPHVTRSACRRWTRSDAATNALRALAERAAADHDVGATSLIFMCLADGPDGEPLISEDGVSLVMKTAAAAIKDCDSPSLESSGCLAARLVTALSDKDRPIRDMTTFVELLTNLYRLNIVIPVGIALVDSNAKLEPSEILTTDLITVVRHQEHPVKDMGRFLQILSNVYVLKPSATRGDSRLSNETWGEILSSWQDGLNVLPKVTRQEFLYFAIRLLHLELFTEIDKFRMLVLDDLVSLCPYLFYEDAAEGSVQPEDLTTLVQFTKDLFDIDDSEAIMTETCALRHLCVANEMNCLYGDGYGPAENVIKDSDVLNITELDVKKLIPYLNKHLFRALYLKNMLTHKMEQHVDDNDEEENLSISWGQKLLLNEDIRNEYCNVLYFYVVVHALWEGYTFWPHHDILKNTKDKLHVLVQEMLAETPTSSRKHIQDMLLEKAIDKGYFWAFAHRVYIHYAVVEEERDPEMTEFGVYDLTKAASGNGFFHIIEAAAKWDGNKELRYKTAYLIMLRSWNIAFAPPDKFKFVQNAVETDEFDFDLVINAYYKNKSTMLYDVDISNAPWAQVVSNVSVLTFLELMIQHHGWDLPAHHWDFITITVCSVISALHKSKNKWGCTKVASVTRAAIRLFAEVRDFILKVPKEAERRQPSDHVVNLIQEWRDIFGPEGFDNILRCTLNILESNDCNELSVPKNQTICSFVNIIPAVDFKNLQPSKSKDLTLEFLTRGACASLKKTSHPAVKYLAYYLIKNIAQDLVWQDSQRFSAWSEEPDTGSEAKRKRPTYSLDYFRETFYDLHEIVDAAVGQFNPGENICELVPFTDVYTLTIGWLLLVDAMSEICQQGRGDLLQTYIILYKEEKYGAHQLAAALRLLPDAILRYGHDSNNQAGLPVNYAEWFHKVQNFHMMFCSTDHVGALACRALCTAICGPGCCDARGFWGATRPHVSRAIERIISGFVSPHAVKQQLTHLNAKSSTLPDAEIRIAWSASEVVCDYTVEESVLQLRIKLTHAHPLIPPRITTPVTAGPGSNTQWLSLYLAYQNGTLIQGLKMWMDSVNTEVKKSPQCYICYCRLHPGTGRLPRVPCHQCKNRFHDMCLRKWFSTSNKSNCPLCRANF